MSNEPADEQRQYEESGGCRTGEADEYQAGEPSKSACWAVQVRPRLHL
jgi:hypothetical protein